MSGTVGTNSSRRSGSIGTAASGATISASDPAIDTNPDGGIGTQWANSTSGEFYVLTDATAGANVWTNVGDGTGGYCALGLSRDFLWIYVWWLRIRGYQCN